MKNLKIEIENEITRTDTSCVHRLTARRIKKITTEKVNDLNILIAADLFSGSILVNIDFSSLIT
jgi:hypothetical protein